MLSATVCFGLTGRITSRPCSKSGDYGAAMALCAAASLGNCLIKPNLCEVIKALPHADNTCATRCGMDDPVRTDTSTRRRKISCPCDREKIEPAPNRVITAGSQGVELSADEVADVHMYFEDAVTLKTVKSRLRQRLSIASRATQTGNSSHSILSLPERAFGRPFPTSC